MNEPFVYIIILCWNGKKWLNDCLSSVVHTAYSNFKILLVDNGSSDGSVEYVRKHFPQIEILLNRDNLGYAEGNNRGIRLALQNGADYIALLNQDIKVEPNWLLNCLDTFRNYNNMGILSPMQYNYEGSAIDSNFLNLLMNENSGFKEQYYKGELGKMYEVMRVIGAAMIVRRDVFEKVGLFDSLYYCYYEETDLCRRTRYHGFKIGIITTSKVFHWHTLIQEGKRDKKTRYLLGRNAAIYGLKNPFCSFYRNLKAHFWWGGVKNVWRTTDSLVDTVLIHLWLVIYLPIIFYKRKQERKTDVSHQDFAICN